MLLATAGPANTDVLNKTFTVQNKPAAVAQRKPSPIISSFLELGRRNCRCSRCGAQEDIIKTKPANIRKWIARFYYFRHLYSLGFNVYYTIIA